jgi:hypothetical protein
VEGGFGIGISQKLKDKWGVRVRTVPQTNRDVIRVLGFNIFASMILDGTVENITGSMSVAVQAGSLDTRELDNEAVLEAETVIREAKTLLARDGTRLQFWNDQGNRKELVVASDACKNQGGYVCITPEGHPERVRSFALPEEAHIFIVARIAVQECCDKSVSRLLLPVDNAAAVFAIRRGWTKNATAMQDIAKLRGTVAEHGCKIQVIFTPGKTQSGGRTVSRHDGGHAEDQRLQQAVSLLSHPTRDRSRGADHTSRRPMGELRLRSTRR